MIKKYQTEIKWGAIFAIFMILWAYLEKMLGWHDELIAKHAYYSMLFVVPAFVLYYIAIKEKRDDDYQGIMSWKQIVVTGAIMGAVVAAFSPLVQYVIHSYVSPDYFNNIIEYSVANGLDQEAAETYFNLSSYIKQAALSAIPLGLVTAAILGIFLRKKT